VPRYTAQILGNEREKYSESQRSLGEVKLPIPSFGSNTNILTCTLVRNMFLTLLYFIERVKMYVYVYIQLDENHSLRYPPQSFIMPLSHYDV
jgi:hypothetical protein